MSPPARLTVVLAALASCALAWRWGGGADGSPVPPHAPSPTASSPSPPPTTRPAPEGYEVALRLLDRLDDARVETSTPTPDPSAHARRVLAAHGRKMRPAWSTARSPAASLATTIALGTRAVETPWSMPTSSGTAWTPDATIRSMNEGSFEQRDALIATPPTTFTFRVTVPRGGKLTFSEGTVNAMRDATVFVVTAVDARGATRELYRHRLPPTRARRWTDASCELDAYVGQTLDLRLSTESATATAEERRAARAQAAEARGATPVPAASDAGSPSKEILSAPAIPVALWGSPTIVTRVVPRVPYNVVWIVVDALRPDVLASFHDDAADAAKLAAPSPPLEALLPKIPGLTPAIDDLTGRGARFTSAYSAASWTRPGTLAMLAGARSSELGLDTQRWDLQPEDTARFYASDPPLLPLMARRHGVATHAFVNNDFMVGYAPAGVEMGFEHVTDYRYRTRDTLEITRDATTWITEHKDTRFFLFLNYASPHEPYEPPSRLLDRIPPPPAGPADEVARLYMAEAAKDDEAIGVLMQTLALAGLRERTIVVLTADHGATMSSAHTGTSGLDRLRIRHHHAVSNFEETTRVPILVVAPGLVPEGVEVKARVRTTDLAPTVAELLGLEAHARFSGTSLLALARGGKEPDERVVVSEGRGTRAVLHGRHRMIVREGAARTTILKSRTVTASEELYDLVDDPGERNDLAPSHPELVAEMRARLDAALHNTAVAGSSSSSAAGARGDATSPVADAKPPAIHLRFAGGARPRRVSGRLVLGDAKVPARSFTVEPVELGRDALTIKEGHAELAFSTLPATAVGFDIVVDPPSAPVSWELYLDDRPWPESGVFGGPYGLLAPTLRSGITTDDARLVARAQVLPIVDPRLETGIFVTRAHGSGGRR